MGMQDIANRLRRRLAVWTFDHSDTAGTAPFLWSKGYARHCDFGGPAGYALADTESVQPDGMFRDAYAAAHDLVWVRLGTASRNGRIVDLDVFVRRALPAIGRPFILLTSDGDASVPSDLDPRTVETLIRSPWLVAWYTQNHDGMGSAKLKPLPIGLDLHTPRPFSSPRRLAETLSGIAARRVPAPQQPLTVFCDIGQSLLPPERRNAVTTLADCGHVVMQKRRVSQAAIWRLYAEHPFVISIRGNGLDCHRTWEALYLGSIVITSTSPLDPLYEGLPVVVVRSWEEVLSRDKLQRWRDRFAPLASQERIARLLDARSRVAKMREQLAAG